MEMDMTVTVRVTSEEHARIIKDELYRAISLRTTIFHITDPVPAVKTIEQIGKEILKQQGFLVESAQKDP